MMQREREKRSGASFKMRGKNKVATHFLFPSLGPAHEKKKKKKNEESNPKVQPPPTREINKTKSRP
jgi:hypothetical protein